MSMKRGSAVLALLLVSGAAVFLSATVSSSRREAREVRIVARGMAFYVNGAGEPNPTLEFTPGEYVRLVIRNEDKGMTHNLQIPSLGVGTKLVEWSQEDAITVRVPLDGVGLTYTCAPHSAMMSGAIVIR